MDSQLVNWGVLDALVLNYAEEEQLLDSENYEGADRRLIELIRGLIETGRIAEALDVINQSAPTLLEDPHLLFRLQKQRFLELLRGGDPERQQQAIMCSRTTLGPCALNAYPEAYEEFKRILLALMFDKDDPDSPVADEWSEGKRAELAAIVASTLKAQQHAYDPLFSLMLRYLISVQNAYCHQQGLMSPIADIATSILVKERDPPAAPRSGGEAPNFSEADVQALAQAADLPRQAAVNSLRYTEGDLTFAFKNELSRLRINTALVDELVREYCLYRGLIERGSNSNDSGASSAVVAAELTNFLSVDVMKRMKSCTGMKTAHPHLSQDTLVSEVQKGTDENKVTCIKNGERNILLDANILELESPVKGKLENAAVESTQVVAENCQLSEDVVMLDCDVENCCERLGHSQNEDRAHEDARLDSSGVCSTSGQSYVSSNGGHKSSPRNTTAQETSDVPSAGRRHWRGRKPLVLSDFHTGSWLPPTGVPHEHHSVLQLSQDTNLKSSPGARIPAQHQQDSQDVIIETYSRALEIRQLAMEGKTNEVIQEVQRIHPDFFERHPHLLFQLKQVEFLRFVEDGTYIEALRIARSDLGPLSAKHPDLLKPLKETVMALARPKGEIPLKPTPPSVLAAALQVALGASLGIAEPKLMKIIRNCLHMHTEWFKLQMCSDRFGELLSINAVKETNSVGSASTSGGSSIGLGSLNDQTAVNVSSTRMGEIGGSQQSESREGLLFDEMAILTIMEWMALSRGDAIQLLTQYDGSVESVLANLI
ncbi:hypothetical protein R1sor_015966 [Riccia sorocarpa]|uniref:CTLH domain-containing protein n=1 Tax=Riccia sorocarpa TaxID=122646 RepID=A0ABD3HDQ0_9MARC